jgi:two-component system, sensor histidine kinase LadS
MRAFFPISSFLLAERLIDAARGQSSSLLTTLTQTFLFAIVAVLLQSEAQARGQTQAGKVAQTQSQPQQQAKLVEITETSKQISVNPYLELLEDTESQLSISQVSSPEFDSRFMSPAKGVESLGYRSGTVWLRFKVRANSALIEPKWILLVNHPNIDSVILYRPEIAYEPVRTIWLASNETGDSQPFGNREVEYRAPAFYLNPAAQETQTYYLKLTTTGSMTFPVSLWTPAEFQSRVISEYFAFGAYFGCFIVLAFYNLSLFAAVKKRVYAAFFFYHGLMGLFIAVLMGLSYQFLWPNSSAWANATPNIVQSAVYVLALFFLNEYLALRERSPRLFAVSSALQIVTVIWLLLVIVLPYNTVTYHANHLVGAACMLVMTVSAVSVSRAGHREGHFYLAGSAAVVVGALIYLASAYGYMLIGDWSRWGLLIGALIDAAIMSLGLSDRIAQLRKSEEAAQAKTIDTIRQAEQQLEVRVTERTAELQEVNERLQQAIVAQSRTEQQLRENEEAMRFAAHHDGLTALPNRALLNDRLRQAIMRAKRDLSKVAVMMIDLDNFKQINDTLGHSAGDLLLTSVAERLQAGIREQDTVARFGGDEFVVVLSDLKSPEDALPIAEKLLTSLCPPIEIGTQQMSTSGSIGIAIYPDHAQDGEFLLRAADKAMYLSKNAGRNQATLYSLAR